MKKINIPPVKTPLFSGDCARQQQLNRSVDELFGKLKTEDRKQKKTIGGHPSSVNRPQSSELILSILFFVCLFGCAILGAAL
jgi:hypothetical protein